MKRPAFVRALVPALEAAFSILSERETRLLMSSWRSMRPQFMGRFAARSTTSLRLSCGDGSLPQPSFRDPCQAIRSICA
jgi:hypothetical protein